MGAFNKLFGRLRLTSDVNVATQTTTVIQTDTTNSNLAIVPNGTGALIASIPDGTATGVSVDDTKVSTDLLAVRRNAAGTIAVSPHTSAGTQVIETIAGSLTTANVAYSAGGSSNLVITFTAPTFSGGGSLIMDIVAALEITELGF